MPMWTPPVQERLPIEDGGEMMKTMMMTMMITLMKTMMMTMMKTMIMLRAKSTLR